MVKYDYPSIPECWDMRLLNLHVILVNHTICWTMALHSQKNEHNIKLNIISHQCTTILELKYTMVHLKNDELFAQSYNINHKLALERNKYLNKFNVSHRSIVSSPWKCPDNSSIATISITIPLWNLGEQSMYNLLLINESKSLPPLMKGAILS